MSQVAWPLADHMCIAHHAEVILPTVHVELCVTVFNCSHPTAFSKAFPFYVITLYWVVSFVVMRHHWLGDNYWAAISYRPGLITLSSCGGVYFVGTHDAFGLRTGNRFLLVTDEVTYTFYICSVV